MQAEQNLKLVPTYEWPQFSASGLMSKFRQIEHFKWGRISIWSSSSDIASQDQFELRKEPFKECFSVF